MGRRNELALAVKFSEVVCARLNLGQLFARVLGRPGKHQPRLVVVASQKFLKLMAGTGQIRGDQVSLELSQWFFNGWTIEGFCAHDVGLISPQQRACLRSPTERWGIRSVFRASHGGLFRLRETFPGSEYDTPDCWA